MLSSTAMSQTPLPSAGGAVRPSWPAPIFLAQGGATNGRPGAVHIAPMRDGMVGSGTGATRRNGSELIQGLPEGGISPHTNLLIVDDCTLYRENLAAVLRADEMGTVSLAWDLASLRTALQGGKPSVILLSMATRGSAALLRAALEIRPTVKVIALAIPEEDESQIVACAEAGVVGYHLRTDSLNDLLAMIRRVADGESLCSPRISAILLRRLSQLASQRQPVAAMELVLTAREDQILGMLEIGLSNRDIAARLCIAVHTVKNHIHSVLTKLGVSTRAEAAALSRTMQRSRMDTWKLSPASSDGSDDPCTDGVAGQGPVRSAVG
jgi:DNA-binding NarL/FixJ family response regulator